MKAETKKLVLMILWGALAVILLAAITWFIYNLLQFKTYENKKHHFSMKYPSKWLIKEGFVGTVVTFVRPKQTALSIFEPNVNITVEEVQAQIATLESFSAMITKQMTAVFKKKINIVEDKEFIFGNRRGHRLIVDAPEPQHLKAIFIWTVKGSFAYIFTYMSQLDQYAEIAPTLDQMVKSFEFK